MSDSFHSTVDGTTSNFNVILQDGRTLKSDGVTSVRLLPYGPPPNAVIQSAGGMPEVRTYKLYFDNQGDFGALKHCRGHHGILAMPDGEGSLDCTLQSISNGWINWDLQILEADVTVVADNV